MVINLTESRWRPEGKRGSGDWNRWLSPWQVLQWSPDMHSTVSRNVVKCMDTWRTTVMDQRRWWSFDPATLSRLRWARITSPAWIAGGGVSSGSDLRQVTVQWQTPFSWTRSLICRAETSRFCAVTWSSPVSKIIALRSCYNIVIAILSKFLLVQAWIHAQSLCGCTVSLKFRLYQPDSLTLRVIISKFFITTVLTLLSKIVLLW